MLYEETAAKFDTSEKIKPRVVFDKKLLWINQHLLKITNQKTIINSIDKQAKIKWKQNDN